jgi:hypothetical protein
MLIFLRIFGALILAGSLTLGAATFMHSRPPVQVTQVPVRSAPELDPTALRGGIVILIGGFLVLHERRRKCE